MFSSFARKEVEEVEEQERVCGRHKRCVRANDCPDYMEKKMLLKNWNIETDKSKIEKELRDTVCNRKKRAVCCKSEDEERCKEGQSCIPVDQCGYAQDLQVQYEKGDSEAKEELLELICDIKENKHECAISSCSCLKYKN